MVTIDQLSELPGYELVEKGLRDLGENVVSEESYLVQIGSPNLVAAGLLKAPSEGDDPDLALYRLLTEKGEDAHYQYKALTERLVKFEQSLTFYKF